MPNRQASDANEAGHQGRDRQPGKDISTSRQRDPSPEEAGSASHAQSRSADAAKGAETSTGQDQLRTGPKRPPADESRNNPPQRGKKSNALVGRRHS